MPLDSQILAVIDALYDAALVPERWPDALRLLTDLSESQAATVWVLDGAQTPRLPVFQCINFDPLFIQEYLEDMAPHDPTVQYLVAHPDQPIVHDAMVISEPAKDRHPYYAWHARHSDTRFRLVGQVCSAPGLQAGVALHRRRRAGRYEQADIDRFALLHRHLGRALAIGVRLASESDLLHGTLEVLARHPDAIILLDDCRRLVYANPAAENYRTRHDGVRLTANGFSLTHKPDDDRLRIQIQEAIGGAAAGSRMGAVRATRPSGKRSYTVLVSRLARERAPRSQVAPAVLVMVTDPESRPPLATELLSAIFGLTKAESALAIRLAAGEDLRASADALGVTYGTARVRLAAIFQKTETRRQGELVKLLITTLPLL